MYINKCRLLDFPKVSDPRGNLSFIEGQRHVPFDIKRVFYIYDMPTEESRGAHAHKTLEQVIICLAGSFDVAIDDGLEQRRIHLNRPWRGLYIPPLIWSAETNFDPGSVCLVLTSDFYCVGDYHRDYNEYLEAVASARLKAAAATT
jgi:uncharacterized RmlC-like cupin family protein